MKWLWFVHSFLSSILPWLEICLSN